MVFRHVASVPLKMPGVCQPVLGWSSWGDGGSQSRASVRVCLLCAFITLMAVSFLSLPLSLSFSFSSPRCCWHTLGALTSQASLSQSWIFAVASFRLCVFSFSSFTCLGLSVSLSVPPTPAQLEGPPALVQPRAHLVSSSCPQMQQALACSAPS